MSISYHTNNGAKMNTQKEAVFLAVTHFYGKKFENGNIEIVIPCSPMAIRSHYISLGEFIKQSNYKLINSKYVDEFKKIIAYVKLEVTSNEGISNIKS